MQVRVGNRIFHGEYGEGTVVAMSREWCVFYSEEMLCELAVPWGEVSIPCVPADPGKGLDAFDSGGNHVEMAVEEDDEATDNETNSG